MQYEYVYTTDSKLSTFNKKNDWAVGRILQFKKILEHWKKTFTRYCLAK